MRPIRNLTLLLILGAAPLQAQDAAGAAPAARKAPAQPQPAGLTLKEVRESFAKADADQSRSLSAEEASKAGLDAAAFSAADADADLKLSLDEFTVGSESRAAKGSAGAAADLTAESTRLQALRRAQKSEELKSRREALAPAAARTANPVAGAPASGGSPASGDEASAPAAPAGPAAARRALAPENPAEKEKSLLEIRASIVRRLRNGEISQDEARKSIEAIDRRIANAATEPSSPSSTAPIAVEPAGSTPAAEPSGPNHELRAIEERLSRRLRNSELDPAKAKALYDDTIRRVENARGANAPQPPEPGQSTTGATPAEIRAKIAEAQSDLTRRLRNAKVTPEQAELERAALAKRLRNAVESTSTGGTAGSAAASDATSGTASSGERTSSAGASADAPKPAPARARAEGAARVAPIPEPAAGAQPPRRANDATAPPTNPVPPAAPARGSSNAPAPAAQPAVTPPAAPATEKERGQAKPARPAPITPKPATPPVDGGSGGR